MALFRFLFVAVMFLRMDLAVSEWSGKRARACEQNNEGIRRTGYLTRTTLSNCQKKCVGSCRAIDFYFHTGWCNFFDEACTNPLKSYDGASNYILHYQKKKLYPLWSGKRARACEQNNEGIRRTGHLTRTTLSNCQKQCVGSCRAVDFYFRTGWCNFFDKACTNPLKSYNGASNYMLHYQKKPFYLKKCDKGRRLLSDKSPDKSCKCVVVEVVRTNKVPAGTRHEAGVVGTIRVYVSDGESLAGGNYIFEGATLELPYRNNKKDVSSLPATSTVPYVDYSNTVPQDPDAPDYYATTLRPGNWNKGGGLFIGIETAFTNANGETQYRPETVGGRTYVKFHGNPGYDQNLYPEHLKGCIGIGVETAVSAEGVKLTDTNKATNDFYDKIRKYAADGYEIRAKFVEPNTDNSDSYFSPKEIAEEALPDVPVDTPVIFERTGDFKHVNFQADNKGFVISFTAIISVASVFSSCIDGNTLLTVRGTGHVPANRVSLADKIWGQDHGQEPKWCTVISNTDHGQGQVYGNFTADHIVERDSRLTTHGSANGQMRFAPLVNIATDCHLVLTADGQRFTPFSSAFCVNLSWESYLQVLASVTSLTMAGNGSLRFLWNPMSWHDNRSHPLFGTLPELCDSIVECAGQKNCTHFEKVIGEMIDYNLDKDKRDLVLAVWNDTETMALAVQQAGYSQTNAVPHYLLGVLLMILSVAIVITIVVIVVVRAYNVTTRQSTSHQERDRP